jgi:outer membrane protein
MKKIHHFITTTAVMLALISGHAYAAELKVGVVNLNLVLQKSPLMTSLNSDLVKRFQPRQTELVSVQKQLQDETDKLNINAGNMSNDDQNALKNKIATDQANLQILTATFQKDLAIAKNEAMQKFTSKVNAVIKSIAQGDSYDMIEQSNNMLFIKPNLDITQQVINQVK